MPQYYIEPQELASGSFTLKGPEAVHAARVMRIAAGDSITVFDGLGGKWRAVVTEAGRDELACRVEEKLVVAPPALKVDLYFAPISKNNISELLDACTQLGVRSFTPVITARCEHKIADKADRKAEAWHKTLLAACKQCGRADIPAVHEPVSFSSAIKICGSGVICLLTAGTVPLNSALETLAVPRGGSIAVFVGPEGGFTDEEARLAAEAGLLPVTLGVNTLRAETACAAACAILCAPAR